MFFRNIILLQLHGARAHRWTTLRLPDVETGLSFVSSQAGILFPGVPREIAKHLQGATDSGWSHEGPNQSGGHRSLETSKGDSRTSDRLTYDLAEFKRRYFSPRIQQPLLFQHEYNQQNEIIPKLEGELAKVRKTLMDGLQRMIDRGQKLDDLVQKTQTLQIMVNYLRFNDFTLNAVKIASAIPGLFKYLTLSLEEYIIRRNI